MSDFLEIPNLRQKSDKLLSDTFGHWCLGIKPKPDPFLPDRGREWFVVYALAAAAYRWIILFGIALFLYTVLKPYGLQSIGATMAAFSIGGIFFTMGKSVYTKVNAPRKDLAQQAAHVRVAGGPRGRRRGRDGDPAAVPHRGPRSSPNRPAGRRFTSPSPARLSGDPRRARWSGSPKATCLAVLESDTAGRRTEPADGPHRGANQAAERHADGRPRLGRPNSPRNRRPR